MSVGCWKLLQLPMDKLPSSFRRKLVLLVLFEVVGDPGSVASAIRSSPDAAMVKPDEALTNVSSDHIVVIGVMFL